MSVDTAPSGLGVSLRPEGADVATQAVSPTCGPLRASSSPGVRRMGHTQPPALHRAGLASLPLPWPHVLPPGGEALLAGLGAHSARAAAHRDPPQRTRWLRGGGGLNHPGASHPADTPACSTQVCVFFGEGEGG